MSKLLQQFVEELRSGKLRVIDLTQPLSSETPILPLPPQFATLPDSSCASSLAMTSAARRGTGMPSPPASTPARTLTRPSTGSAAKIFPTTAWIAFQPNSSSAPRV